MHLRRLPTALGEAISDRKIATSPLRAEIPAVTRVGRRLVVKRLSRRSLETRPPLIRDDRPGLLLSQVLRCHSSVQFLLQCCSHQDGSVMVAKIFGFKHWR